MKIKMLNGYLQVEKQEPLKNGGLIVYAPGRYDFLKVLSGPDDMAGKIYISPIGRCMEADGELYCHVDDILMEVVDSVEVR